MACFDDVRPIMAISENLCELAYYIEKCISRYSQTMVEVIIVKMSVFWNVVFLYGFI